MQAVRQAASGLLYALISLVLVVGSLSLVLAEKNTNLPPTSTPFANPSATFPATATIQLTTAGATAAGATATLALATVQAPPTSTLFFPTAHIATQGTSTAVKTCGPLFGWVRAYIVQPGDTLFHIAVSYGTTVARLQRSNCRTSTVIFVGERLWVPYVATLTPGVTVIPYFDTPTDMPTEPGSPSAPAETSTPLPTDTATLDP